LRPTILEAKKLTKSISTKYSSSGTAIRATSQGWEVMASPCMENSNTMVNSNPYNDQGPILGRKVFSYQARPLAFSPKVRVKKPASSGMPKKTSTETTIAPIENSAEVVSSPSQEGRAWR